MTLLNRNDVLAAAHDLFCVSLESVMEENGIRRPYPKDWEAFASTVDPVDDVTQLEIMWRILGRVEQAWGFDVGLVFHHAGITDPDRALYYLVMGCIGHGVSLEDYYSDALDRAASVLKQWTGGTFDASPIDIEDTEWRMLAEERFPQSVDTE